jgi:hypothetical protein
MWLAFFFIFGVGQVTAFPSPRAAEGVNMLDSGKMVVFVSTQDYDNARALYEGKLESVFVSQDQFCFGDERGWPQDSDDENTDFTPLPGTILGWEVEDIQATATWLKNRGVNLEKYPFAPDRELGIWTAPSGDKVAWFKDAEGNILSVTQHS